MPVRFNGKQDLIGILTLLAFPAVIAMIVAPLMPLGKTKIILILLLIIPFLIWIVFRKKTKS